MKTRGLATELIHRGEDEPVRADSLIVPIYETTTFLFENADEVQRYQEGRVDKYLYSRYANPTIVVAEQKIAALDRAEAALVFASGMAATSTILWTFLRPGDQLLCGSAIYGGTFHLANEVVRQFGVDVRFATLEEFAEPEALIGDRTRLCWFESPINPTLRCVDVARVASACRAKGVLSVLDNTFASPINQQPLALGVDLAMQSATKYLNGHSDVTGGAVTGSSRAPAEDRPDAPLPRWRDGPAGGLRPLARPQDAAAPHGPSQPVGRGRRALPRRGSAGDAASSTRAWTRTPTTQVARAQMTGFGGMVTFEVPDGLAGASRVFDRLQVIRRATSLGGVDSLVSLPVLTSHYNYSDEDLRARRRDRRDAARVDRPRGRGGPHRRPGPGPGLAAERQLAPLLPAPGARAGTGPSGRGAAG